MSSTRISCHINAPRAAIYRALREVINGKRSVTPDTALRLARVTGMSADFWLGLQQDWDLWHALRSDEAAEIARLKPVGERQLRAR